jgi:hypothetical protein
MPKRLKKLPRMEQYFVRLRGFDIWRRVQVPRCADHQLTQVFFNSFGWFGRVGSPGEPAEEGKQVLWVQRTAPAEETGWITIMAPPITPQHRLSESNGEDEPWYFDAMLEGRLRLATPHVLPRCLDGEWACPPYGFTTPADYRLFLGVISDPSHPQCEELLRWCPFDPHAFDAAAVTDAMRRQQWGGRDLLAGLARSVMHLSQPLAVSEPPWISEQS